MFIVRAAQQEAFYNAARAPFHYRVLAFLHGTVPEKLENQSNEELLLRIAEADRRATGHGLRTERGITQFVALTFLVGPQFDQIPQVRRLLAHHEPDPDTRINWLVKTLRIYKEAQKEEADRKASVLDRLSDSADKVTGVILAMLLAPFQLFAVGSMAAGAEMAGGLAAAGEGLAALGTAAAVLTSPVTLTVVAVAAIAIGGYLLWNQATKVDEKSKEISKNKAATSEVECPKSEEDSAQNTDKLKEKAQKLKELNKGRNRVTLKDKIVDLDGKPHHSKPLGKDIDTPHTRDPNPPHPPDSPGAGRDPGFQKVPRPATEQDLQEVEDFLRGNTQ